MVLMPHLDFLSDDRFEVCKKKVNELSLLTGTPVFTACHHFSDQQGYFVAHMKPRKCNCKGWDLLTG